MIREQLTIPVSQSLGSVSAEVIRGDDVKFLFVFAHGAGAGMHHAFMVNLSLALAEWGIATLRYHFNYMEKGSKRPDPPAVAVKTVNAAIAIAHTLYPTIPLLAGGKSFGGRMTSHALAQMPHASIMGLVFTGYPLHPAGRPGTDRAAHLPAVGIPMLFLQGTRDALADMTLMKQVCDSLPTATLRKFEGADHSFKAGKADLIPALAKAIWEWTSAL